MPLRAKKSDPGWVYFIVSDDHHIKVGWSGDPDERLKALRVATPHKLTLLEAVPGSRVDEEDLKDALQPHCVRGEWFRDCAAVRTAMAKARAAALTGSNLRPAENESVYKAWLNERARAAVEKLPY